MNIGEMQRKLSLWAEQDKGRKFYGLFDLIRDMAWLRLAHDHVAQNAGSKTAGCDGLDMGAFDEDLEYNILALHEALKTGTFKACPVRRVYIPKANGRVRPLGIPMLRSYCTPYQKPWEWVLAGGAVSPFFDLVLFSSSPDQMVR
jgi:RNA-directed DNA polymerase